jgi:branched-chain amino acid transport system ATP-binding protein
MHTLENRTIEVIGIDVFYEDSQALWDVSFHVPDKNIVALVGANGAGKSTLLNTISGILRPRKGEILFCGKPMTDLEPEEIVQTGISHVPEGRRLFFRLTVMENLELGAFPPKARPHMQKSLARIFKLFPILKERIKQEAGSLSGGEQQMLAIARAIMARPTLLMLDEPSLGLAPIVMERVFKTIQALNEEGISILLVEQNVHLTLEITSYVYVLQTGKLTMEGRSDELLQNQNFQRSYLGIRG